MQAAGIGEASLSHALVVIFLEFFAWGLLTVPVINVLAETFPTNSFLMNGLILGVKVHIAVCLVEVYNIPVKTPAGYIVISIGTSHWRPVGYMGSQGVPPSHRLLHMHAHTVPAHQSMV